MDIDKVEKLMKTRNWRYKFEILPGIYTPGHLKVDPLKFIDAHGIPGNLKGKRVLDIGAWDGVYSFELERRGAMVWALDIQDPDQTGFNVAKKILNSKVKYIKDSVYYLNRKDHGQFDIVLFAGVYYHLKHPLLALKNIYDVLNDHGFLGFSGQILDYAFIKEEKLKGFKKEIRKFMIKDLPITLFVSDTYINEKSNWFIPNKACLKEWMKSTGFKDIKIKLYDQYSTCIGFSYKNVSFNNFEHALVGEDKKSYGL